MSTARTIYKVTIQTIDKGDWFQWFDFSPTIGNVIKSIETWKGHQELKSIIPNILTQINIDDWNAALKVHGSTWPVIIASVKIGSFKIERQHALTEKCLC